MADLLPGKLSLPGKSSQFRKFLQPASLHSDLSAFLLHPSMIEILRSPKMCMPCIQKTAKHDCIRESVLAIGRSLILGAPGVLLAPSRGWGHVSQPCEDTCLSRLIQGDTSPDERGSEQRMSPDFEMCNVRLPSDSQGKSRVEMVNV